MAPLLDPGHSYQRPYAARFDWTLGRIGGSIQRALADLPREQRVTAPR